MTGICLMRRSQQDPHLQKQRKAGIVFFYDLPALPQHFLKRICRETLRQLNIAKVIQKKRKERHLTQDDIAAYIGVSKASVSKWETGQSPSPAYSD